MIYIVVISIVIMLIADFKKSAQEDERKENNSDIARILCNGKNIRRKFSYKNIKDCSVAYENFGNNSFCPGGCIGLDSCVRACPESAIDENLFVDLLKCKACKSCVKVCPLNLIVLAQKSQEIFHKCAISIDVDDIEENCVSGCRKCYICLGVCDKRAISIDKLGLPVIDYSKCNNCFKCVVKCPNEIIKKYDKNNA